MNILAKKGQASFSINEIASGRYAVYNNNDLYKNLDCVMGTAQVKAWVKSLREQGYMIAELN